MNLEDSCNSTLSYAAIFPMLVSEDSGLNSTRTGLYEVLVGSMGTGKEAAAFARISILSSGSPDRL